MSIELCSQKDALGNPRLNTDINCTAWCDKLYWTGDCGTAALNFCTANPGHLACRCQNFKNTLQYKNVVDKFSSLQDCEGCKAVPDPVCWASICTQGNASSNP